MWNITQGRWRGLVSDDTYSFPDRLSGNRLVRWGISSGTGERHAPPSRTYFARSLRATRCGMLMSTSGSRLLLSNRMDAHFRKLVGASLYGISLPSIVIESTQQDFPIREGHAVSTFGECAVEQRWGDKLRP